MSTTTEAPKVPEAPTLAVLAEVTAMIASRVDELVPAADRCNDEAEVGRLLVFAHEVGLAGGFIAETAERLNEAALERGMELGQALPGFDQLARWFGTEALAANDLAKRRNDS